MRSESPLPVMTPMPGAHFFRYIQSDGHGDERPQQGVAVLRASRRIRGDSSGVVVHVGGDEARADHREEQSKRRQVERVRLRTCVARKPQASIRAVIVFKSIAELPDHLLLDLTKISQTFAASRVTTSSTVIAPIGPPLSSTIPNRAGCICRTIQRFPFLRHPCAAKAKARI